MSVLRDDDQLHACRADVGVVLGAAQYDGVPSSAFERRLALAARLFEEGCIDQLVVSGGARPGDRTTEGASGVAWLERRGVPREALQAETEATTTVENLRNSHAMLGELPILIISDELHTYRARYVAQRLGIEAGSAGAPVRAGRMSYAFRETVAMLSYRLLGLR